MFTVSSVLGGVLALGLAAAPALAATTYDVALTQAGLGDPGPDWFGTVTVADPAVYGPVSSFSITVAGIVYNSFVLPYLPLNFVPAGWYGPTPLLHEFGAPAPYAGEPISVLWFALLTQDEGATYTGVWSLGTCGPHPVGMTCSSGNSWIGTVQLSPQPAPVPLPASGVLALAGLGGLAALRRRR